MMFFYKKII